jgi:Asp-tRNA(Asn)/Glu-tRNA(Gln) amidotransferase A subunit family amidase
MSEQQRTTADLTAQEWHQMMSSGAADIEKTLEGHLSFVQSADESVRAFVSTDANAVTSAALDLVDSRNRGDLAGPLFGVPVGIKDIIDTEDLPTQHGSPIHAGRYAIADATVVRRIRQAGGVVLGKTATTEFATFYPAATRNPHNLDHTPGGSSSGSAAAVAAGFVPVALGTQTNGSVIRPASFCGVYGFKPSYGLIPRTGIFDQSQSLDQVGFFAKNLDDLALVAQLTAGDDGVDPAGRGLAAHRFVDVMGQPPPMTPRFCFVKTPWWDQVSPDAQEAYQAFLDLFEGQIEVLVLPDVVNKAVAWHATVNEAELAAGLSQEWLHHRQALSGPMQKRLQAAHQISAYDYLLAKSRIPHVSDAFAEFFEKYDAILCPAALGEAPKGLESTGNPIMQTVWTFGGLPSVNLPFLTGGSGLPLGVQAVGAFRQDGRLLRSLKWLVSEFETRSQSE